MKVALCISGQARSVEENFENIKKCLIEPNSPDVFVHTWYDEKDVGKRFSGKEKVEKDFINRAVLKKDTKDLITSLYRPKTIMTENQIQFVEDDVLDMKPSDPKNPYCNRWYIRPQFCLSMFYSIMKCNGLKTSYEKENNFMYDAVIRARFDLELDRKYDMKEYDLTAIYANSHTHNQYSRQDVFGFSNSANMDMYSDVFRHVDTMVTDHKVEFCPEILLGYRLNLTGKQIRNVGGGYKIVR